MKSEFSNPFLQSVYNDVHKKNKNALIIITGDTGTGKSYLAQKIANELDPDGFNENTLRERLVARPEQFMELVVKKRDTLKKGSVIIFDEAGTGLAARAWYSANNNAIDYILQTFRYQQLIVIFTVPNMSFIDTHARRLFHYYVEALDIDIKRGLNICKIFKLSYNKMKPDEPYKQYFRTKNSKGEIIVLKRFRFKKVPARIWHEYEEYAAEFKGDIGLRAIAATVKVKEEDKVFNPDKAAEEIMANLNNYVKYWQGKQIVDKELIEINFKIGERKATKIKKLVEMKLRDNNNAVI
jgi:predicted ATPase